MAPIEIFLAATLISLPAHSNEAAHMAELADVAARTSSRDVKVPMALVARVEKDYDKFLDGEGVVTKGQVKRVLLNVRAELKQKRPGALHENARVVTPLGGGVVDLADLVTPVRAAFTAKIAASHEDGTPLTDAKVFFVSRARARTIDGEGFGAGCDKWMDITGYFKKVMTNDGFQLYTADQRYLSVIGGTFVLVGFTKEAISVGSISFTDSRYPNIMCAEERNEKVH